MDLFEYQGKQFFASYGIPVSARRGRRPPSTRPSPSPSGSATPVVVKAQVQVGGRGKAGGVKLADDVDEVREHAGNILGLDIKGHIVERLWIEKASDIAEEYYASFTLDRSAKKHLGMLSAEGGVEIETVAEENPDAIAKIWIDPVDGLTEAACREWVAAANLTRRGHRGHGRHPAEALHRLHRGRRRPGRDQPADPHARRARCTCSTPRSPSTATPRSATRTTTQYDATQVRDERERPAHDEGPPVRRPRGHRRRDRQRCRSGHEHRRRGQPGRRRARPTSSTSAAAPTPT